MNAYGPFCETAEHGRTTETLLTHLDHVVRNFGYEHAGIGFDLCDCLESLREHDGTRTTSSATMRRRRASSRPSARAIRANRPRRYSAAISCASLKM